MSAAHQMYLCVISLALYCVVLYCKIKESPNISDVREYQMVHLIKTKQPLEPHHRLRNGAQAFPFTINFVTVRLFVFK